MPLGACRGKGYKEAQHLEMSAPYLQPLLASNHLNESLLGLGVVLF